MQVIFKAFPKQDGAIALYINGDNGCHIAISEGRDYQSSKATKGETKLWSAAHRAIKLNGETFDGSVSVHTEPKMIGFNLALLITDVACIGGQPVGSDGSYVISYGKFVRCGEWLSSEAEDVDE